MHITAFIAGYVAGFVGSMPTAGPLGLMVAAKGLRGNHNGGLAMAVGGATCEAGYAFLACWGTSLVLGSKPGLVSLGDLAAALLLIGLGGFYILRKRRRDHVSQPRPAVTSFITGFFACALNPALLCTWSVVSSAMLAIGLLGTGTGPALFLAPGVFLGVLSWFFVLLLLLRRFSAAITPVTCERMVTALGFGMLAFGVFFSVKFVAGL